MALHLSICRNGGLPSHIHGAAHFRSMPAELLGRGKAHFCTHPSLISQFPRSSKVQLIALDCETILRFFSVCRMTFNDGELNVVEVQAASDNMMEKDGLTQQDRIDMAEVGKKQQFNVRSVLRDSCACIWPVLCANNCQRNFGFVSMLGKLSEPTRRIMN